MPRKGERATPAQMAALKRGQAKRTRALKNRTADEESQQARWRRLLDGTLRVEDLSDEEVKRGRVGSSSGIFTGPKPRLPSHLAQAFSREQLKRAQGKIRQEGLTSAIQTLIDIASDPEHKDQFKAAQWLAEHCLGKAPATVHISADDKFGKLVSDAMEMDRDLHDLLSEHEL